MKRNILADNESNMSISCGQFSNKGLHNFPSFDEISSFDVLDFSLNPITSLRTLPVLPLLEELNMEGTNLESFAHAQRQPTLKKIILKNTPVSFYPGVRIMTLVALGSWIQYVDDQEITEEEIKIAEKLTPRLRPLLLTGWVLTEADPPRIVHCQTHACGTLDEISKNSENKEIDFKSSAVPQQEITKAQEQAKQDVFSITSEKGIKIKDENDISEVVTMKKPSAIEFTPLPVKGKKSGKKSKKKSILKKPPELSLNPPSTYKPLQSDSMDNDTNTFSESMKIGNSDVEFDTRSPVYANTPIYSPLYQRKPSLIIQQEQLNPEIKEEEEEEKQENQNEQKVVVPEKRSLFETPKVPAEKKRRKYTHKKKNLEVASNIVITDILRDDSSVMSRMDEVNLEISPSYSVQLAIREGKDKKNFPVYSFEIGDVEQKLPAIENPPVVNEQINQEEKKSRKSQLVINESSSTSSSVSVSNGEEEEEYSYEEDSSSIADSSNSTPNAPKSSTKSSTPESSSNQQTTNKLIETPLVVDLKKSMPKDNSSNRDSDEEEEEEEEEEDSEPHVFIPDKKPEPQSVSYSSSYQSEQESEKNSPPIPILNQNRKQGQNQNQNQQPKKVDSDNDEEEEEEEKKEEKKSAVPQKASDEIKKESTKIKAPPPLPVPDPMIDALTVEVKRRISNTGDNETSSKDDKKSKHSSTSSKGHHHHHHRHQKSQRGEMSVERAKDIFQEFLGSSSRQVPKIKENDSNPVYSVDDSSVSLLKKKETEVPAIFMSSESGKGINNTTHRTSKRKDKIMMPPVSKRTSHRDNMSSSSGTKPVRKAPPLRNTELYGTVDDSPDFQDDINAIMRDVKSKKKNSTRKGQTTDGIIAPEKSPLPTKKSPAFLSKRPPPMNTNFDL